MTAAISSGTSGSSRRSGTIFLSASRIAFGGVTFTYTLFRFGSNGASSASNEPEIAGSISPNGVWTLLPFASSSWMSSNMASKQKRAVALVMFNSLATSARIVSRFAVPTGTTSARYGTASFVLSGFFLIR